jgi:hypothetical protein
VWGVADDDVLNVRAAAGVDRPIVSTLAPGTRGVRLFDVSRRIGRGLWSPIRIPGGVGWLNVRYLRPEGPTNPAIQGNRDPAVAAAGNQTVRALRTGDLTRLAALVDPELGVTVSPSGFVRADAVVLTRAQVQGAAADRTRQLWGYTEGEGAPIRETVAERLRAISGSTALTSTSVISYDRFVTTGSIDNLGRRFPGGRVVEYHFAGTSRHHELDWTSVRLVFSTAGPSPTLVGIVQDAWAP